MVLSRKKLKRKRVEVEIAAPLASSDSAEGETEVENGKLQAKKEKKRKRDKVVAVDTPVVESAGVSDEGDGGVEIERPVGGENASKNKRKKEKKKRSKVAEVPITDNEDRLSNGKLNGAVDHSEADVEPAPANADRGGHEENGFAENGGHGSRDQGTENGDHKEMTVRERKGKKKKDRWGGLVQEEEHEAAVEAVDHEEEHKGQTSGGGTEEMSAGEKYDPKKVYVGGMPYYVSEDDIVNYFTECGKITELDCVLFPDTGKFRGLAFITFETEEGARNALEWDGQEMGGRFLKVTQCKIRAPKGKNTPASEVQKHEGCLSAYVGNLSWNITEDVLKDFLTKDFKQIKIESIRFAYDKDTGDFRGFGHIDFVDDVSLESAVSLNQTPLLGRPVKIAYSVQKRNPSTSSADYGGESRPSTCRSCGKEGHKAFTCTVKGGKPEWERKVRRG